MGARMRADLISPTPIKENQTEENVPGTAMPDAVTMATLPSQGRSI